MQTVSITVKRNYVLEEVAKATDYTGSKLMGSDAGALNRILATDEDLAELGILWDEAAMAIDETFKEQIISPGTNSEALNDDYHATMMMSEGFDISLIPTLESILRSFFITSVIAGWFKYTNKEEAADYYAKGAEYLKAAERIVYYRKRPNRPK